MLQPERTFWLGRSVSLSGVERDAFDKKYPAYPFGLRFPLRIEVAPGEHAFYYRGGKSWLSCIVELNLQAGHVYKPDGILCTFRNIHPGVTHMRACYARLTPAQTGKASSSR